MADSHFTIILMALFLPNKELFTKFRHVQPRTKTRRIIFSVTQNRTCELPQSLRDFDVN